MLHDEGHRTRGTWQEMPSEAKSSPHSERQDLSGAAPLSECVVAARCQVSLG